MGDSKISWTQKVWNPTIGCTKVSAGCEHCYAMQLASRLELMGQESYRGLTVKHNDGSVNWTGVVRKMMGRIEDPFKWQKPSMIFVDSMSDLFHEDVPFWFIAQIWAVMSLTPHTYQILTKRPDRMLEFLNWSELHHAVLRSAETFRLTRPRLREFLIEDPKLHPSKNIWLGTSTEDQAQVDARVPILLKVPAYVHFISAEPLLESLDLRNYVGRVVSDSMSDYKPELLVKWPRLDWVITGAESGAGRRVFDPNWVRSIRDQCVSAGVAYYHKQGSDFKPGMNRELDGRTWDQFPGLSA